MNGYSGIVDCDCGQKHNVEHVTQGYRKYKFSFHSLWVRYVECSRCLKIEFQVHKYRAGFDYLEDEKHTGQHICNECRPSYVKSHIEKFDGMTPGTFQILDKLNECLLRLGSIEERLSTLEQKERSIK